MSLTQCTNPIYAGQFKPLAQLWSLRTHGLWIWSVATTPHPRVRSGRARGRFTTASFAQVDREAHHERPETPEKALRVVSTVPAHVARVRGDGSVRKLWLIHCADVSSSVLLVSTGQHTMQKKHGQDKQTRCERRPQYFSSSTSPLAASDRASNGSCMES